MSTPSPRKPAYLRAASAAARLLGRERLVSWLGVLYASELMTGRLRRVTRGRLKRIAAFRGEAPDAEALDARVRAIGERYAEHMADTLLLEPGRPPATMELPESALAEARRAGRGVILVSPHFGDAARAMISLPAAGIPLTAVFIDGLPFKWLAGLGISVLSAGEGAVDVVRALAANEAVWLNVDIDLFSDEREAPLFGAPVRPPHGAARLAQATGAAILPVYPVKRGETWKLEADAAIAPDGETGAIEDAILRSVERFAGAHPDHWWLFSDLWDLKSVDAEARFLLRRLYWLRTVRRLFGAS